MNELNIIIHNWNHISDQSINVLTRIALLRLHKAKIDYSKVKEFHTEFKDYGVEMYLKWK